MSENNTKYNLSQLMVTAAAREIADGEVVFVGMRLPLLGFLLAKNTHAPNAVGVYELGIVRATAAPEPLMTMGDLPNLCRAQWLADTADTMGLLQQGGVDVSFIGGAQVDRFGNLNTSYIGGIESIETRLPGSGGACDRKGLERVGNDSDAGPGFRPHGAHDGHRKGQIDNADQRICNLDGIGLE